MSDHGTHHHHEAAHSTEIKSRTAFSASFWFVLILVGLFVAAVNFISVMGHEEGGHGTAGGHGAPATHEAAGHSGTPEHATGHEDRGEGAADVHTFGSSDNSNLKHGTEAKDSAAHH